MRRKTTAEWREKLRQIERSIQAVGFELSLNKIKREELRIEEESLKNQRDQAKNELRRRRTVRI